MDRVSPEKRSIRQEESFSRQELLAQLERIVASSHFRNSKRYPSFLRFIVERTVEENTEVLKERNLGTEVFGRPSDYDTGADPIVRVTAGEVRKRIAQYYQTPGHENELRIDLPLGSYVPHFYPGGVAADHSHVDLEPPSPELRVDTSRHANSVQHEAAVAGAEVDVPPTDARSSDSGRTNRRTFLLIGLGGFVVLALIATAMFVVSGAKTRSQNAGIEYFWKSFAPANSNALIVIGVHFSDATGKAVPADPGVSVVRNEQQSALASMVASDMVPVSDIVSYSRITDLLTRRSVPYRTKGSTDTTLDELRRGPVILVGGFNNVWTMRLVSTLRYRFVPKSENVNEIQDSHHPAITWTFDNLQPAIGNSRDYAIVASYYDPTIEQHVVIAAGIGKNGTVAASEFLTTEKDVKSWLAQEKLPANKNVELVLSTEVLDGEPGPPHVIAESVW